MTKKPLLPIGQDTRAFDPLLLDPFVVQGPISVRVIEIGLPPRLPAFTTDSGIINEPRRGSSPTIYAC